MASEKNKAIYAGTFDPFTYGHKEIVERALKIFDEVTILIAVSPTKTPVISKEQRLEMLSELFKDEPKVRVDFWSGLIVEYAKQNDISSIVRGLRPTGDFDIEFQQASMNSKLYPEIDTVFFMTQGEHYFISSSMVREILTHGGDIAPYVPDVICEHLKNVQA